MAVRHLVTKGFPSVPFLITEGLGGFSTSSSTAPVYGGGRKYKGKRDWKALGDAEYQIHKIGTAVPKKYVERLEQAVEAAPAPEPEKVPAWLPEFIEQEDWRDNFAAMDLILERVDRSLQELVETWLRREIAKQIRDEEDAIAILLLH